MPLDEMLRGFREIPFLAFLVLPRAQHCQSLSDPSFQGFFWMAPGICDGQRTAKQVRGPRLG